MAIPHVVAARSFFQLAVAAAAGRQVVAVSVASAAEAGVSAAAAQAQVGNDMRTKEFLSKLEHDRIVLAIREAEAKMSRQIRVYVHRGKLDADPLIDAQKRFHRMGMHTTRERNAVLIFVAPRAHKFAVVGDKAIHEKCGEEFWQRLVEGMRTHFRNEKFNHAIVEAVEEIGKVLAAHFPKTRRGGGELSDE